MGRLIFDLYEESNETIVYYTHQGLGDLISCAPIVNFLGLTFPNKNILYYINNPHYEETVKKLICEKNCKTLLLKDYKAQGKPKDRRHFLKYCEKNNYNLIFSGGMNYYTDPEKHWDYAFYDNIGINYDVKYKHFYIDRDEISEEKSFLELTEGKPYIFVHDDPSRGRNIKIENKDNLKIVKNDVNYSIFDFINIIQNAKESHIMGSSLLCLIDFFDLDFVNHKYFFYDFRGSNVNFKNKKKWIIKKQK